MLKESKAFEEYLIDYCSLKRRNQPEDSLTSQGSPEHALMHRGRNSDTLAHARSLSRDLAFLSGSQTDRIQAYASSTNHAHTQRGI